MTISTETNEVTYFGNGSTRTFAFTWDAPAEEIAAELITPTGTSPVTDFTVALNPNVGLWPAGGILTYPADPGDPALPVGHSLRIYRKPEFLQGTELRNQGAFLPEAIERGLDRSVMRDLYLRDRLAVVEQSVDDLDSAVADAQAAQAAAEAAQLAAEAAKNDAQSAESGASGYAAAAAGSAAAAASILASAILVPPPEAGFTIPDAATRANMVLGFDASGDPIATSGGSGGIASVSDRAALQDLPPGGAALITEEGGRNGLFIWSPVDNSANVTADPAQGIYVPPSSDATGGSGCWVRFVPSLKNLNAVWFGLASGGAAAADNVTAVQRALDLGGFGCRVYIPAGSWYFNGTINLNTSGQEVYGDGVRNTFLFNANATSSLFNVGNSISFAERLRLRSFAIMHHDGTSSVIRTNGADIVCDHVASVLIEDIKIETAYNGMQLGGATFAACMGVVIRDCHISQTNDGILITSAAGTFIISSGISGYLSAASPGSPSAGMGVRVIGAADGLWIDANSVIQTCNRAVFIGHSSGSCASMCIHCQTAFCSTAHFSIECSGTASINGFYVRGGEHSGYGATEAALYINETSSGSISNVVFSECVLKNIGQRVVFTVSAVSELDINNLVSINGGIGAASTYAAVELGSAAHGRVSVCNNRFDGQHTYGLSNANGASVIKVVGNDMVGASGVINNFGTASNTRLQRGNIGINDAG